MCWLSPVAPQAKLAFPRVCELNIFYALSSLPSHHLIVFSFLQYFRMELMNAEKQRKEKKELERAKMNLVGHVDLLWNTICLCITHFKVELQGFLLMIRLRTA